jgi:hypothetical protein
LTSSARIDTVVDPSRREVALARVELGFTLYLADAFHWAQTGAGQALTRYLERFPRHYHLRYCTSRSMHWRRATNDVLSLSRRALLSAPTTRIALGAWTGRGCWRGRSRWTRCCAPAAAGP